MMFRSPPDIHPLALVALQQVPHLATKCAEQHVLKELRSACSEGRLRANDAVSGVTMHLDGTFSTRDPTMLLSVLHACILRRICVVFHLENHEHTEKDLSALSTCLQKFMSSVKQMTISLQGVQKDEHHQTADAAAALIRLGHECAPLTHLTVTGLVSIDFTGSYKPLIEAARQVCSASLTHLTIIMRMLRPGIVPDNAAYDGDDDGWLDCLAPFNKDTHATQLQELSLFTHLTHLQMKRWYLLEKEEWAALPLTLQCLSIWGTECSLPGDLLLPNMHKVTLTRSKCSTLLQLLAACPKLEHLGLISLSTPNTNDEQKYFRQIVGHSTWSLNSTQPTKCISVRELCRCAPSKVYPEEESDEFDAWGMMEELPIVPTITTFRFELFDGYYLAPPSPDVLPVLEMEPLLHHIPRVFPNLLCLHLDNLREIGLDLMPLHACTSLCELHVYKCYHVTGEALLQLATALPKLVKLDTDNYAGHEDVLSAMFANRLMQQGG